jgi:hypothetical protein
MQYIACLPAACLPLPLKLIHSGSASRRPALGEPFGTNPFLPAATWLTEGLAMVYFH